MNAPARVAVTAAGLLLAACGGDYGGEVDSTPAAAGGNGTGSGNGSGSVQSCADLFTQRVQPRLEFCRNCHVPGGVADVEDGRDFMLSTVAAADAATFRASWERLGANANPPSRILRMASGTDTRAHSGGVPWPVGSAPYQDVERLLLGFVDPAACVIGGPPVAELDLLGSKHARHRWASFCEGKADDTSLPTDPRSLVRPGANAGRAVYFNAFWEDCHVNMPAAEQQAATCGEYRRRRDSGRDFLLDELPSGATSAAAFNNTWQKWGLSERPDNFDQLYTLRYGLNPAPFHNPYPLPGEDPNATDGGSGRLPLGLRQTRDTEGRWTGQIASGACFACHGGGVGDPAAGEDVMAFENLGLGNANYDVLMAGQDNAPWQQMPYSYLLPALSIEAMFNIGIKQRGQNNAVGAFELLVTVLDWDSLGVNPNPFKSAVAGGETGPQDTAHPIAHTQDTPAWWNMGSRPRKFFDAGASNDSTRIIMAAGSTEELLTGDGKPYRDRIEKYDQDLEAFFLSLRSPDYPRAVDEALARQGAILFHSKDLWALPANADLPRPAGGNGSSARCHGASSPRFVNDPLYLEDPVLEGVAAHIVPIDLIGTDRARSDILTPTLRKLWDTTYWGYTDGVEGWVAPEDKDPMTEAADDNSPLRPVGVCGWEKGVIGYQAPPLYGTWATAPYFHNGSVPTIEAVLDSSMRHAIWRRQLQTDGPVTGFDQRLAEAYDFAALGWKHVALACTDIPGTAQLNCSPVPGDAGPSASQIVQNFLAGLGWPGIATISDPAEGAIDKRLVYDTRTLGNANSGHEFTDALTEQERRAIVEYLKTL